MNLRWYQCIYRPDGVSPSKTDATGLNELAKRRQVDLSIASRCGVLPKSDIQPLLNESAAPADIAASIFQAIAKIGPSRAWLWSPYPRLRRVSQRPLRYTL